MRLEDVLLSLPSNGQVGFTAKETRKIPEEPAKSKPSLGDAETESSGKGVWYAEEPD
jgi:hypothetical protein